MTEAKKTTEVVTTIDVNALHFGDAKEFKKATGVDMFDALGERYIYGADGKPVVDERGKPVKTSNPTAETVVVLLWLTNRKVNPDFTMEQAEQIPLSSLTFADDEAGEA